MDQDTLLSTMIVYCKAFDERDTSRRLDLLRRSMTPTAEIWGPNRLFVGHSEISEKIDGFHINWPSCRLAITTGFNTFMNSAHHGVAILGPDGVVRASGRNVMEFAPDGRIQRVLPLWEELPPLPQGWPPHFAPLRQNQA